MTTTEEIGTCGAQATSGDGGFHTCRYDEGHSGPHQSHWLSRDGWKVGIDWFRTKNNGHAVATWAPGGGPR